MGTVAEVISPDVRAPRIVFAEARRIEDIFSSYKRGATVFQLNKNGSVNAPHELLEVLSYARKMCQITGERFDITIGPLSSLWKQAFQQKELPTKAEIANSKKSIGMDGLAITGSTITLTKSDMILDFGALAKGYAIDRALEKLKEAGIGSALINIGGDVYCLGRKFGKQWSVGVRHPRQKERIIDTIKVENAAVVTSGDYEQFMQINGIRYSHVINPLSGYPVSNAVVSVTVVADSCMVADAVATSLFLLGKEEGLKILKNHEGVKNITVLEENDVSDT